MSFNPFEIEIKQPQLEFNIKPLKIDENTPPLSKLRVKFALSLSAGSLHLTRFGFYFSSSQIRRTLAKLEEIDFFSELSFKNELVDENENAILSQMLEVITLALCAQNETNKQLKNSFNFLLAEDIDHVYTLNEKYLSCFSTREMITNLNAWKESPSIMAAIDTKTQLRNYYDDIRRPIKASESLTQSKINVWLVWATQAFLSPVKDQQISLIELQHLNHIESLFDPSLTALEQLLCFKFAQCHALNSLYNDEDEENIKPVFSDALNCTIYQLQELAPLTNTSILSDMHLPAHFKLGEAAEESYLIHALRQMKNKTMLMGEIADKTNRQIWHS